VRWGTFGFHKTRGISWLAANQLASQEGTLLHGVSKYAQATVFNTTWRCGKMLLFGCVHLNTWNNSASIKVLSRNGIALFAFFYEDWIIYDAGRTETGILFLPLIYPWRWKRYVPLNRQGSIVERRSFLSQKNRIANPPRKSERLERLVFKMSTLHGYRSKQICSFVWYTHISWKRERLSFV
jgi:hypothetical protein